jgi:predicted tellurium resistance membrane protein TerC
VGLMLALGGRVALLGSLFWLSHLTKPLFSVGSFDVTARDVVLFLGGAYLIWKATIELKEHVKGHQAPPPKAGSAAGKQLFGKIMAQIVVMDIVFSLDSVITAVGLVDDIRLMAAAIVVAIAVMLLLADSISEFVDRHPSVKTLALLLLWVVGAVLVLDGLHIHIDKGYVYAALAFSMVSEVLNILRRRNTHKA